jgi:uncharacterized protein (TIGR02266 family)
MKRVMSNERRRAERRQSQQTIAEDRRAAERRSHDRRTEARLPLDLWVEEEKGNELYFRRTGNLSLGGVWFEQTIPHALGTRVRLRFSLPGVQSPIETLAEIVNTPPTKEALGMGLRFVDLSEAARATLQSFLDAEA